MRRWLLKTTDYDQLWREWNRGSGYESEAFLSQRTRSMSVGDVLERDGTYTAVAPVGWQEIEVGAYDEPYR